MVVQDTETDAKYKCTECNLQFGTPRDLSRHLNKTARHGGQPCPCAICHKPLTRPDSRSRHERRCRDRFGVTEEMWRGIERERQRGRRKSISIEGGVDEGRPLSAVAESSGEGPSMSIPRAGPSRSRTVSISEYSDADLATAFASARVASSAPGPSPVPPSASPRFVAQPGEPGSWTRARSASLRARPPPPLHAATTRTRHPDASSPPQPHTHWRPLNHGMQDESDGEPMTSPYRTRIPPSVHPHWTTLAPDGVDDAEVDELAGDDDDESWHPPPRPHGHVHAPVRTPETMMAPPPKKKLFGFESQGSGATPGWSPHMGKTPR
jgi:hypothetical protein